VVLCEELAEGRGVLGGRGHFDDVCYCSYNLTSFIPEASI
jgi:hypothetical protein